MRNLYRAILGEGFLLIIILSSLFVVLGSLPEKSRPVDWTRLTWFEVLLIAGYAFGIVQYLYRVACMTVFGKLLQQEVVEGALPFTQEVGICLAGYQSARIIFLSPEVNLSWLRGKISLRTSAGELVDQILLNTRDVEELKMGRRPQRIRSGGKGAPRYVLSILSTRQIDTSDPQWKLHLDLDWNSGRYSKEGKTRFEVFVRAVKAGHT